MKILNMNSLPFELLRRIAESVCNADLKLLRLVNRQWAAAAASPLFATLHLSGPASLSRLPSDDDTPQRNNVEYGRLHETIEAVLPLARYVKTLHFSPAYYRAGFWQDYRAYVESQIDEPIDVEDLDIDESDDEEDFDAKMERAMEEAEDARNTRLTREASLIEEGESFYHHKSEEQVANARRISDALRSLFEAMTALKKIEIKPWEFENFKELDLISDDMDQQRRDSSSTAMLTELLAESMQSAHRHVESLHLNELVPESFHVTSATRHLFAGIKHLQLGIYHTDFMLESAPASSTLAYLFECCQRTLESLEIMGAGKWAHLPARGEHSLLKIVCDADNAVAPIFPELRFLGLRSLILSTTSLITFIASQPKLQSLSFDYIYLATSAIGWPALASSLPDPVQHWRVSYNVGHEPFPGFVPPIAYNWIAKWDPGAEGLLEDYGWKSQKTPDCRWTIFHRPGVSIENQMVSDQIVSGGLGPIFPIYPTHEQIF